MTSRDDATLSVEVRVAADSEMEEVFSVCSTALGWKSPDFDAQLFRWKHVDNAFGRSLLLVAVDRNAPIGERILAVRPFMRWRFADSEGKPVTAARAVDTATLPAAQGKGLFGTLTLAGVEQLISENCGFIFNTPNSKSLPGYLKMGWFDAGEVRFGFGVTTPGAAARILRSRVAAQKQSIPTPELGMAVDDALRAIDPSAIANAATDASHLHTDHDADTLRWRYAEGPIVYRYLLAGADDGVIVRLRARGEIRELVVAQVIGTPPPSTVAGIVRDAMEAVDADVCVAPAGLRRTVSIPKVGPTLALRSLTRPISADHFTWSPGDVEIF